MLWYQFCRILNETFKKSCTIHTTTIMLIVIYCCRIEEIWCQLPEDGEIIAPKHVRSM